MKHIHFIGIAGSLIAPLAVAMKRAGWKVTGSDRAFYPPASALLEENGIKISPGFAAEKFKHIGKPDLAVLMSFLTPRNPEVQFIQQNRIELIGLGQFLERYFIKKNSIVVAGNFGKTTITALVGWMLEVAGFKPTVLAGGHILNFNSGVKIGESDWSVSEGDEFQVWHITGDYQFSRRPRLFYQKPKYVILTDATWDHYDQYPTEDSYIKMYEKFVRSVPKNGFVLGNCRGARVREILALSLAPTQCLEIQSPNIGFMNNSLASAMAKKIGIRDADIERAINTFQGIKRRQEIRFSNNQMIVIDDFAHSPVKLKGLSEMLRVRYPENKKVLVYQPGSKDERALHAYGEHTFAGFDFVFLPRVSSVVKNSREFNARLFEHLRQSFALRQKTRYIADDEKLVLDIIETARRLQKDAPHPVLVVFAGQKGFRGMIEKTISMASLSLA